MTRSDISFSCIALRRFARSAPLRCMRYDGAPSLPFVLLHLVVDVFDGNAGLGEHGL